MGCAKYWDQLRALDTAMGALRDVGIGVGTQAYDALWRQRGAVLGKLRAMAPSPRESTTAAHVKVVGRLRALGLEFAAASPRIHISELEEATVRVWFDIEQEWLAEARLSPGAPPIYHSLTTEEAVSLIKETPTPELIASLFHVTEPVDN
jgi:hypothetical protein